jgi:hypothetical protein
MARLVVLRFENDQDADDFLESTFYARDEIEGYRRIPLRGSAVMMVQTPTKFCECVFRGDGFRRGEKRGWWIHVGCGKPTVMWGENPRAVLDEAIDLLEKPSRNTDENLRDNWRTAEDVQTELT